MKAEEIGVVREESGIEVALDGGEVVGVVFESGVVALGGDCRSRDDEQKSEGAWAGQVEVILQKLRAESYELRAEASAAR